MTRVISLSSPAPSAATWVGSLSFRCAAALLALTAAASPVTAQQSRDSRRSATVSFSFVNAPLADVVAGVVRDTLGRRFRIVPNLSGRITVVSGGPVTPARALAMLDASLRDAGARLVIRSNLV